jgi:type I restriction enzyme S subunit
MTPLIPQFDLLATAPGGVARLRELILTLAVQGKLVPQDASDEPAASVLARIGNAADKQPRKTSQRVLSIENEEPPAPYELPEHWAWARLGNLVENMGSGWSPACDEGERNDSTGWAVLRTTAVQLMEYRPREHKVIPIKLNPRPEIEVKNGDILITRAGPMNRVGVSCCVDQTPARLMLSDKIVRFHSIADELFSPFVVLSLNAGWTKAQIETAKTGMAASQVNISQSDIRNLWVPVCSKAEQSRIVARVEELMRLCDALESQRKLETAQHARLLSTVLGTLTDSTSAEELAANWQRVSVHFDLLLDRPQAVDALEQTILQLAVRGLLVPQDPSDEPASVLLQKIRAEKDRLIAEGKIKPDKPQSELTNEETPFDLPSGWRWARFDDLINPLKPISYGVLVPGAEVADGIPFVRIADLSVTCPAVKPEKSISPEVDAQYQRTRLDGGEILMGVVGSIGKLGIAPQSWAGANIARAVCRIVPVSEVGTDFVLQLLESAFMQKNFAGDTRTLAQPTLNVGLIRSAPTPLPPLAEQTRIVTRVTQLRSLCADLRQRLSARQTTQSHLAEALVEV